LAYLLLLASGSEHRMQPQQFRTRHATAAVLDPACKSSSPGHGVQTQQFWTPLAASGCQHLPKPRAHVRFMPGASKKFLIAGGSRLRSGRPKDPQSPSLGQFEIETPERIRGVVRAGSLRKRFLAPLEPRGLGNGVVERFEGVEVA
jgi:hypothetical protein